MGSPRPPSEDEIERGARHCLVIAWDRGSPGSILPEIGDARWHCRTEPCRSAWSALNLLRKPDFVLVDQEERGVLRIRRASRLPPRFSILQNGEVVGTIGLRSFLRNKYSIVLTDGPTWTFRMPLFRIYFHGESSSDSRLWIQVGPGKTQWNLLAQAGADDVRLLAALAFIHREWWCYS
jgi:hypothetical protein